MRRASASSAPGRRGSPALTIWRAWATPVTVYDANDRPGGALAYAIPPYRLPREVVAGEASALYALGIAFRCGVRVGTDLPLRGSA